MHAGGGGICVSQTLCPRESLPHPPTHTRIGTRNAREEKRMTPIVRTFAHRRPAEPWFTQDPCARSLAGRGLTGVELGATALEDAAGARARAEGGAGLVAR